MINFVYPTTLCVCYNENVHSIDENISLFEKRLHDFVKTTIKEMGGNKLFFPNRFFLTKRIGKTNFLKITTKKFTIDKNTTIYKYYLSPRWKSKYNREEYVKEIRNFIGELMTNNFWVTEFNEDLFLTGEM